MNATLTKEETNIAYLNDRLKLHQGLIDAKLVREARDEEHYILFKALTLISNGVRNPKDIAFKALEVTKVKYKRST